MCSSAYVTSKSDAIQMFLKCMLLLPTMYCMFACQMQIKGYLLTYLLKCFPGGGTWSEGSGYSSSSHKSGSEKPIHLRGWSAVCDASK